MEGVHNFDLQKHWGNSYRMFTEFKMFYLSTLFVKETINHIYYQPYATVKHVFE